MALTTVSSDRLSTNVKNTNFTAAEKQDLTDDILPLAKQFGQSKNLVVNGSCLVAQRGVSQTGVAANGYATVDRFRADQSGTDAYIEQHQVDVASGTTPYAAGLRKAFQVKNGNQTSGAGTSDRVIILYRMESQDFANSGWDYTSSSSYITFSYYVKSSVAQNFFVTLKTADGTPQKYATETGTLTANQWTKVTKTIPGNSNLQFDNDSNEGMELEWSIFRGTATTGSMSLNAWAANNNSVRTPDQTSTWYTTDDATFEITGVQIEVSNVATDFEHRSFAQELALCQRYFYMHASGAESASTGNQAPIGLGYGYTSTDCYVVVKFPVTMRHYPTMFKVVGTDYFRFAYNNNNAYPDSVGNNRSGINSAEIYFDTGASWDQNAGGMVRINDNAARLGFTAEL